MILLLLSCASYFEAVLCPFKLIYYISFFMLPSLFDADLQKSMSWRGFCSVKSLRVFPLKGESNFNEIKSS